MSAIRRMLWRDLWHLRGQMLAVALVVMCGVAAFVSMHSTYRSLLAAQQQYYASHRFADLFVHLKRAPLALADKIRALPGVVAVDARIVVDAVIDVPGLAEPASGRLISLPRARQPQLNQLDLRAGRLPEAGRQGEVVVSAAFASANGLQPGATLGAVINGRWRTLRIVGSALSPEYVYEAGSGSIFPDNKRFGVMWMADDALAAAFDLNGAFNDLTLQLVPQADSLELIEHIDGLLAGYGGLGAYARDEQLSHRFLSDEIAQNRVSASYVPSIFLAVAGFLLHIVLARLVSLRRSEIGLLKAFGYSDMVVGLHYLQLAGVVVLAGAGAGIGLGLDLAHRLTQMYLDYYRFPALPLAVEPGLLAMALGLSLLAACSGALGAVRSAVRLPPAEAMRPEPPARFHSGWLERSGMQQRLSPAWRMIARNLLRRRWKALLSCIGIACSVAILVIGGYFFDAMNYLIDNQFRQVQREDLSVSFNQAVDSTALTELRRLPGVLRAEPFRILPVKLRAGHRSWRGELTALTPDSVLRQLPAGAVGARQLPAAGILLTRQLAQRLHLTPGDALQIEVQEGERPLLHTRLAGLTDDLVGAAGYLELANLNRQLRQPGLISGAWLQIDPAYAPQLLVRLKQLPRVATVAMKQAMLNSFQEILDRSLLITTAANLAFAAVIAFGMVYNGARIALSERGNELACLRVLGFNHREVAVILMGEQGLLTLAAIPLGWLSGYLICALLSSRLTTELYRIPLVIAAQTYWYAALTIAIAAALSGLLVARRLRQLDLIAVLKTRE